MDGSQQCLLGCSNGHRNFHDLSLGLTNEARLRLASAFPTWKDRRLRCQLPFSSRRRGTDNVHCCPSSGPTCLFVGFHQPLLPNTETLMEASNTSQHDKHTSPKLKLGQGVTFQKQTNGKIYWRYPKLSVFPSLFSPHSFSLPLILEPSLL